MADSRLDKIKQRRKLTKEEKFGLFLLLIVGGLGAIFGLKSFPAMLNRPFEIQLASYNGPRFMTTSEREAEAVEKQKSTDSDSDGLNDYEELYIYKTSPFLADSDSDGFNDKEEIFSSHDPNCPEGKDCNQAVATAVDSGGTGSDVQQQNEGLAQVLNLGSVNLPSNGFSSIEEATVFLTNLDPASIRSMMLNQGVPKEVIDQMTDAEIKDLMKNALQDPETQQDLQSLLSTSATENTEPEVVGE